MNRSRALRLLVFALYVLVLSEFVLQAAYRLSVGEFLFTRTAHAWYAASPIGNYRLKPDLDETHATGEFRARVVTNAQGFRVAQPGMDTLRSKPPGIFRILLLGPSFAFGYGVDHDETLGAHVERWLGEAGWAGNRRIELVNAGVPGLPPAHQLAWFEAEGVHYEPDLVIQLAYGSLLVPAETVDRDVTPEGHLVDRGVGASERWRARLKRLAVVHYGWMLATRLRAALSTPPAPGVGGGAIVGAGRPLENASAFSPEAEPVGRAVAYYERLDAAARAVGARALIVHFPLSYCVHRDDMARWQHLGVKDVDTQIAFNADLCDHLNARGLDCLNATPDLVDAARQGDQRLYYWLDIHWTEAGNRVVARSIVRHLRARGTPTKDGGS